MRAPHVFLLAIMATAAAPTRAQVVAEEPARTIRCSKAEVSCLAISPKGDKILIGLDHGAEIYDLESGRKLFTLPFSEDESNVVYYCAFNDNGEFVVLIGYTGKRQVYDVKNGKQEKVLTPHKWIPDPRQTKSLGLQAGNSSFDRFYQQAMSAHHDITARAGVDGGIEFVDDEGTVLQTITQPTNKDPHHRAPCLFHEQWFITGTDDGRVLFYSLR